MKETMELLLLLGLAVVGNILGGVYININLNKVEFDWKKLVSGIIKALCVSAMFLILALIIEKLPNLAESLGVEPKAMIVSAIGIYAGKVIGHLTKIFGFKKEEPPSKEAVEETEYVDI